MIETTTVECPVCHWPAPTQREPGEQATVPPHRPHDRTATGGWVPRRRLTDGRGHADPRRKKFISIDGRKVQAGSKCDGSGRRAVAVGKRNPGEVAGTAEALDWGSKWSGV